MDQPIILGALVVISIVMVIYSLIPSRKNEEAHLKRRISGKGPNQKGGVYQPHKERSAAKELLDKVTPLAMRPVMPAKEEEMTALREKLAQAGFRRETATRYFLASKTILGLALAGLMVLIGLSTAIAPQKLAGLCIFVGGVGFLLPNLWLAIAKSSRTEKIRNGLPDSLDLLVVSVESGLALDGALQRVGDEMAKVHPELSEEMRIAVLETQMGVPRMEALEKMSRRCGVEEVRSLVSVIGQAEQFGTSVAKALRTQSDSLRTKRRQAAEERAQKTTVKLMLPLILFIFPSIFVVLIGPAAMKIIETFSKGKL